MLAFPTPEDRNRWQAPALHQTPKAHKGTMDVAMHAKGTVKYLSS